MSVEATVRSSNKCRIGIVGFGSLGKYLARRILLDAAAAECCELVMVWNRTSAALGASLDDADAVAAGNSSIGSSTSSSSAAPTSSSSSSPLYLPSSCRCSDLEEVVAAGSRWRDAFDLIVEVSHPDVTRAYGPALLKLAPYYMGSPTGLADGAGVASAMRAASAATGHAVYVPVGAMWGAHDISRMADRNSIASLRVTMKKHPASLKVEGELVERVAAALEADTPPGNPTFLAPVSKEREIFVGSVRDLCPLAPSNVNTMAAAAIAAHTLGFEGVQARLVADASLSSHVIEIDLRGKTGLHIVTRRDNPAAPGAITGAATFASFFSSLLQVVKDISAGKRGKLAGAAAVEGEITTASPSGTAAATPPAFPVLC